MAVVVVLFVVVVEMVVVVVVVLVVVVVVVVLACSVTQFNISGHLFFTHDLNEKFIRKYPVEAVCRSSTQFTVEVV